MLAYRRSSTRLQNHHMCLLPHRLANASSCHRPLQFQPHLGCRIHLNSHPLLSMSVDCACWRYRVPHDPACWRSRIPHDSGHTSGVDFVHLLYVECRYRDQTSPVSDLKCRAIPATSRVSTSSTPYLKCRLRRYKLRMLVSTNAARLWPLLLLLLLKGSRQG